MGLFDALKEFARSVDQIYDRRIRQASLVKEYDPTGALHHHGVHAELHNEHVDALDVDTGNGHVTVEPTQTEQSAPREVTHH